LKIDLGLVRMDIPDGYLPATLLTMGQEDSKGTAAGAGPALPTMSKAKQAVSYRRVIAISFAPLETTSVPDEVLVRGLNDIQARARGKTVVSQDRQIAGMPAKYIEIRHAAEQTPVYSLALMTFADKQLRSYVFTMLDDPPVIEECKKHFESMLASLATGIAMPDNAPTQKKPAPPAKGPGRR
jgi:hypothetical protein